MLAQHSSGSLINQTLLTSNIAPQANSDLDNRSIALEGEVRALANAGDQSLVKYGDSGFRTLREATLWLAENFQSSTGVFGYILDFHTMMQHISSESSSGQEISEENVSKQMGKANKLNFNGIAETTAVDSFGFKIPTFFSTNKDDVIICDNQSYFSKIRTFEEWLHSHEGKREKLKQRLDDFRYSFEAIINQNTVSLSRFNLLCVRALHDCISWTEDLMKFIDDTYNTYHLAHFGADKAWHVTARLVTKSIQIVAKPRIGMELSFKSQEKDQIGNTIFYTALRSLDEMMTIRRNRFKHHPEVTSELSQYLAMNTDFEATQILQKSVNHLTDVTKRSRSS